MKTKRKATKAKGNREVAPSLPYAPGEDRHEKMIAERSAVLPIGTVCTLYGGDQDGEEVRIVGAFSCYPVTASKGGHAEYLDFRDGVPINYMRGYVARERNGKETFWPAWRLVEKGAKKGFSHLRLIK